VSPTLDADEPDGKAEYMAGDGARPRVLVVDDDGLNREMAARLLERTGCRVAAAANGREAVEQLARLSFHVVFMDCVMPVMDGYAATTAIRALPGERGRTPIVAMTGGATPEDRARCFAAGMDDYLCKPVRPEQLREAVTRWTRSPNR